MLEKFRNIIRGSKRYEINGTILTVTSYYTGESVSIDLAAITEDMLDEIAFDDDED